jgi:hypothetical protein
VNLLPRAALLLAALLPGPLDEPSPDVVDPPPADQFLVIPLHVHLLQCDDLPEAHCALADDDIRRIVGKVNRVWRPAGVHFGLAAITREPAARVGRFRRLRDAREGPAPLGLYRLLLPDDGRDADGLHVYYLHAFPVNGVYLGDGLAIVQETASLREVEGGIDEPLPRVTAHELGHALGLSHRQARTNLLASGTTGTRLNADEVARARQRAAAWPGALRVTDLRRRAESAERGGDSETACRLASWLDEISDPK